MLLLGIAINMDEIDDYMPQAIILQYVGNLVPNAAPWALCHEAVADWLLYISQRTLRAFPPAYPLFQGISINPFPL
ncbi:MAG: hypothetical protein CMO33_05595 [Verrucomicrobia bacterium]|nr:hypothetical protein [Verrucomicrobiota bacterium]